MSHYSIVSSTVDAALLMTFSSRLSSWCRHKLSICTL